MASLSSWVYLSVAVAAAGCSSTRPAQDTDSATTAATSITTTGQGTDSSASDSAATTGENLDIGVTTMDTAADGGNKMGCEKVDFLFVIDNSGSMGDEQDSLIASFPKFITTIKSTLDMAQSYHIMTVDTDAWVYGGCEAICPLFMNTCFIAPEYQCGVTQPEECEDVLGAGVTHPKGLQSSNTDCMFSTGARYMDTTEQDLVGKFSCAAKVGTGSTEDPEKPMEAMVAALSKAGNAHDCNLGFLRSDAILVVTFITDEDDDANDGSAGTVEGWRQALIAAKGGDENAVVVLGLFGDQDQPDAQCAPLDPNNNGGAEPSPRLREFVESWGPRGFAGSVCAADYEEFFAEAVGIIDTTCDDFIPPG